MKRELQGLSFPLQRMAQLRLLTGHIYGGRKCPSTKFLQEPSDRHSLLILWLSLARGNGVAGVTPASAFLRANVVGACAQLAVPADALSVGEGGVIAEVTWEHYSGIHVEGRYRDKDSDCAGISASSEPAGHSCARNGTSAWLSIIRG